MKPVVSVMLLLLVGCYADPVRPPEPSATPAILFTNGCGFTAAFEISLDRGLNTFTILSPVDTLRKATTAGLHEISYFALSLGGEVLNAADDTLTVRGPTPYRLVCVP